MMQVHGLPRADDMKPTAERILDAAETEFARKGYDAASLTDIAAHVGIRVPSLYKHYAGKRDLYVAVAHRLLDPYVELLDGALGIPDDAAEAERNLLAVAEHYFETPNLARLVQHAALAGGEALDLLVDHWHAPLFERAAELTANARVDAARALAMVVAFHSMMSGYVTMASLHAKLIGRDPLGRPAIAAQLELMRGLVAGIWTGPPATGGRRAAPARRPAARRSRDRSTPPAR